MVCVVSRFRLTAPPGISSSCISPLTSSGQRSRASWASQTQTSATLSPQPGGKPRKFIRTCGGIGEKDTALNSKGALAAPCFKPLLTLNSEDECLPILTLAHISLFKIMHNSTNFFFSENLVYAFHSTLPFSTQRHKLLENQ